MKRILLMCCFLVGISAVCHAQGGGMRMDPATMAKQMQTQLKLSDDQTTKITAILQNQRTQMDSIRKASNGDRDAMRSGMMPVRMSSNTQIKAILTPDQLAGYQKMMQDMRGRMQQGGGAGGGGGN